MFHYKDSFIRNYILFHKKSLHTHIHTYMIENKVFIFVGESQFVLHILDNMFTSTYNIYIYIYIYIYTTLHNEMNQIYIYIDR